jgi:nucleoid DNA-binding protein
VNKAELIEALSGRLGDRKSATAALDAVLAEIQNAVTKGDKVSITGFGVFEKRLNPRYQLIGVERLLQFFGGRSISG